MPVMDTPTHPLDVLTKLCQDAIKLHSMIRTNLYSCAETATPGIKHTVLSLHNSRLGELLGIYRAICYFNGWDPDTDGGTGYGDRAETYVYDWWRINYGQSESFSIAEIDALIDSYRQDALGDVDRWFCDTERQLATLPDAFNARSTALAVAAALTLHGTHARIQEWSNPNTASLAIAGDTVASYTLTHAGWSVLRSAQSAARLGNAADIPITTLRRQTDPRAVAMAIIRHHNNTAQSIT
jgi:hypothetical protein